MWLAGICARRRTHFLLLRQKKVSKEKATLLSVSLRCATGNLRYGPLLRSAWPSRREAPARSGPSAAMARVGLFNPLGCAWGGVLAGWHGRPSAHASCSDLPRLSERSAQRAVSSAAHPASAPPQVCPVAQAKGPQTWGRLSFGYFSLAKQRKVPRPPGRDPASHQEKKSYSGNTSKRYSRKNNRDYPGAR